MKPVELALFGPGESISEEKGQQTVRYSISTVRQGAHQFYTLTMHISILAETCYVSPRFEDPKQGFQRRLDKLRAKQIADYIDIENGVIPNSIILSAQPAAQLKVIGRGKTVEFSPTKKAFLVLDGQHRVFGFSQAKTFLRVPVVIFNDLEHSEEARLFMDINTKQRPVSNELLLDIKKLAGYETGKEQLLGEVYDLFNSMPDSPLNGLLSPFEKSSGTLSRVTFNAGVKPLLGSFRKGSPSRIYGLLSPYLNAFIKGCEGIGLESSVTHPQMFRAAMKLFTEVAQLIPGKDYSADAFSTALAPIFKKRALLRNPGSSAVALYESFSKALKADFSI